MLSKSGIRMAVGAGTPWLAALIGWVVTLAADTVTDPLISVLFGFGFVFTWPSPYSFLPPFCNCLLWRSMVGNWDRWSPVQRLPPIMDRHRLRVLQSTSRVWS